MIPSQAQLSFSFGGSAAIADAPNLAFKCREMFLLILTMSQNLQRLDQLSAGAERHCKAAEFCEDLFRRRLAPGLLADFVQGTNSQE